MSGRTWLVLGAIALVSLVVVLVDRATDNGALALVALVALAVAGLAAWSMRRGEEVEGEED